MYVLAFDRDWTVDLNPHPRREAVPLRWVRYWAHETAHEVWAIGNQDLVEEADIPGTVESIRRRDGHIDALGPTDESGDYDWWPDRETRLHILAELFPDAAEYVVIDDLDLSHVDGWIHYHAWDFLEAIEAGDLDIQPPNPEDPVPDGGFETGVDVEAILAAGYVFELEYRTDDETTTHLVTHVEPERPSMKPLTGPPTFWFEPVGHGERFSVRLPDIETLHSVPYEQLNEHFREAAVAAVGREIVADDDSVDREMIQTLLADAVDDPTSIDPSVALRLAMNTVNHRDDAREMALEAAFELLEESEPATIQQTLETIWTQTEDAPELLEPHVADLVTYASTDAQYQQPATRCVMEVATANPAAVLDAIPALELAAGAEDTSTRQYAIYALSAVAKAHPEAVLPTRDVLIDAIQREDENSQTNALSALGHIASSYPDAGEPIVEDVVPLLTDEDSQVRSNTVGLLADIAQEHPDIVVEHTETIARCLEDTNTQTRINAAIALLRAGGADPSAIRTQQDVLQESLSDPDPAVRANVCQLIGNAGIKDAGEDLRELVEADDSERVRDRAEWALSRLD